MADHGTTAVKKEKSTKTILLAAPAPHFPSRLPPEVLDTVIFLAISPVSGGYKNYQINTRTLLACALTCRAMLRPAQTHLYNHVILRPVDEPILAFARTIDANPALGQLVRIFELHYHPTPSFYPLPAHVAGRLSNLRQAKFAGIVRHHPADISFMRLFSGFCRSLTHITLAFIGFSTLSDLTRLVWSFPTLESLNLQCCAWSVSQFDDPPKPALHPGHVSKLTYLQLQLDYPAPAPLSLTPFGTNLTVLDLHAQHTYTSTVQLQGISALDKLVTVTLRLTKDDISVLPAALVHVRSPNLRNLRIMHRVESQTREATVWQLNALKPKLADIFRRPAFWGLALFHWAVLCQVLPGDAERQNWKKAVAPFLQVMADRNILRLTVEEHPKPM
ncbi:hypothetical protein L226DRAFT_386679 [Lentinus tigrinus ALCF2SS1-7]|uniref:F-box domain-containing protein n=1 Tax=Lentinus tigrinus ALCF2SS1-6 TaxID=1328759 RepID=A0A5C2SB25_9APHY|nr:hypothetical protein L227DRAFT_611025 [Lentinus tigrinus ALCF2SS1-6]RPD75721.1 hypothetical protein L226DRAFT_386679 [Lentinus tigrinus ALCF2SS1-7]